MDDSIITDNGEANTTKPARLVFFIPPQAYKMVLNTCQVGEKTLAEELGGKGGVGSRNILHSFNWNWTCLQEYNHLLNNDCISYEPDNSLLCDPWLPKQWADMGSTCCATLMPMTPGASPGVFLAQRHLRACSRSAFRDVSIDISSRWTRVTHPKVPVKDFSHQVSWSGSEKNVFWRHLGLVSEVDVCLLAVWISLYWTPSQCS